MGLFHLLKNRFGITKSSRCQRRKPNPTLCRLTIEELESRLLMTSGLVAAYNFDQGSGQTLTDVSGHGNNGILSNANWVSNGKFGGALQFTGSTNSMVTIQNSPSLDLTKGMTLEAWVDPSSLNSSDEGWSAAISKDHQNSINDISYALYAANGTGTPPAVHILRNGHDYGVQGTSNLSLNTWTFLAATYDGSTLKMYVNGNLVVSQRLSGSITTTGDPLHIGGDWSGEMFTGLIDNVRIYNTALSQSAIRSDMKTAVGAPADTPPTVTSVTPANNASGVSTGTPITVKFSEALDPTTVTSSTIQLLDASGNVVAASVTYNASTFTATLTPSSALSAGSTYTILVHGWPAHARADAAIASAPRCAAPTPDPPAHPGTSDRLGRGLEGCGSKGKPPAWVSTGRFFASERSATAGIAWAIHTRERRRWCQGTGDDPRGPLRDLGSVRRGSAELTLELHQAIGLPDDLQVELHVRDEPPARLLGNRSLQQLRLHQGRQHMGEAHQVAGDGSQVGRQRVWPRHRLLLVGPHQGHALAQSRRAVPRRAVVRRRLIRCVHGVGPLCP